MHPCLNRESIQCESNISPINNCNMTTDEGGSKSEIWSVPIEKLNARKNCN